MMQPSSINESVFFCFGLFFLFDLTKLYECVFKKKKNHRSKALNHNYRRT